MPSEAVKVLVRVRPMNNKEKAQNCRTIVEIDEKNTSLKILNLNDPDGHKQFTFDCIFPPTVTQQYIYEQTAFPLVESVVEGYNGTMFAYGQTGCGKTYTMMGEPSDEVQKGIIPRSFSHIVNIIDSTKDKKYLVRCSYIEIYNEEVHDLLGKDVKQKMELKESPDKGIFIKDLTMIVVKNVSEMEKYMVQGNKNRAVGETQMNKDSSRSHSLFTLYIETQEKETIKAGKLNMVDLAGSERQSKTQATGDRLKEGSKINLSLSALGNVISALVDGKTAHIPYRDSKLTRLLQDSLGGNTKTIMIAAASPADYNFEETMSTLRYASRAKFIKNQPKINEDPKDALLKEYAEEIKKLKEILQQQTTGKPLTNVQANQNHSVQASPNTNSNQDKQLEKLSKENQQLNIQQQEYQQMLKAKEDAVEKERRERERMEQMIKELEQKTIVGGKADDEQAKKFRAMQDKLKKQQKEQEKLVQEKEQKENELIFMEKNYQSLQDEVEALRKILKQLRNKYNQALSEIKDVKEDYETEKADLLETIRTQEKENKIFTSIIKMLLTNDEIESIKANSEWVDDEYRVPPFIFKAQKLKFPKLSYPQAIDMIEKEKEQRELIVQPHKQKSSYDGSDHKKHQYTEKYHEPLDSSMEANHLMVKDRDGSFRYEKQKKVNNYHSEKSFADERKPPRILLDPLPNQAERTEKGNSSNSVPPNGQNNKKVQQLKPILDRVDLPRPPKGRHSYDENN